MFETKASLERAAFVGFKTISHLARMSCEPIPEEPGTYLVVRMGSDEPVFLENSPAGRFKGRDPSLSGERLHDEWVPKAVVLYISRAGGPEIKENLRTCIRSYIEFGSGSPVPNWGGRLVWQVVGSDHFLVAWRSDSNLDTRVEERMLLDEFQQEYGRLPFANLTK